MGQKNKIKAIKKIRDKLYHRYFYLERLIELISKREQFEDFEIRNFGLLANEFRLILEEVLLRVFKIIPNYYHLRKKERSQSLQYKDLNLPSLKIRKENRRAKRDKITQNNNLTIREKRIRNLELNREDILKNSKFINIVKFIERLKKKLNSFTQERNILGLIRKEGYLLECEIKFNEELAGTYKFPLYYKEPRNLLHENRLEDLLFESFSNKDGYVLSFEIFFSRIRTASKVDPLIFYDYLSEKWHYPFRIEKTFGTFLTTMIDIKKKVDKELAYLEIMDIYI